MMQESSVDIRQSETGSKVAGVPGDADAAMDSVIAGLPQARRFDEHNRRLAYDLVNFLRRLALPRSVQH